MLKGQPGTSISSSDSVQKNPKIMIAPNSPLSMIALVFAQTAYTKDANDLTAVSAKALCHVYVGDNEKAVTFAKRAIEIAPSAVDGHRILGFALVHSGDGNGALKEFATTMQLSPTDTFNFMDYITEANSHMIMGDFDAAWRGLRQSQNSAPSRRRRRCAPDTPTGVLASVA